MEALCWTSKNMEKILYVQQQGTDKVHFDRYLTME